MYGWANRHRLDDGVRADREPRVGPEHGRVRYRRSRSRVHLATDGKISSVCVPCPDFAAAGISGVLIAQESQFLPSVAARNAPSPNAVIKSTGTEMPITKMTNATPMRKLIRRLRLCVSSLAIYSLPHGIDWCCDGW